MAPRRTGIYSTSQFLKTREFCSCQKPELNICFEHITDGRSTDLGDRDGEIYERAHNIDIDLKFWLVDTQSCRRHPYPICVTNTLVSRPHHLEEMELVMDSRWYHVMVDL